MKKIIAFVIMLTFIISPALQAQPPAGKYNTTNYPEERKEIALMNRLPDSLKHLNDDYIAVGPEGLISYGLEQWKKGFSDAGVTFKSAKPVPGMSVLRVYNGDAAVNHFVVDVVLSTPTGDLPIRVIRTETFIKQEGKWYFVSGQGTMPTSKAEMEKLIRAKPQQ